MTQVTPTRYTRLHNLRYGMLRQLTSFQRHVLKLERRLLESRLPQLFESNREVVLTSGCTATFNLVREWDLGLQAYHYRRCPLHKWLPAKDV